MQTQAQQFVQRFTHLPQPDLQAQDAVAQISAHHQATYELLQELGGRPLAQPHGDEPVLVFPDRSGVRLRRDPRSSFGIPPSYQAHYTALTPFDIERLIWQHRDVQGAIFQGQRAIDDHNFWALRALLQHDFVARVQAPPRTVLRAARDFTVHGFARNLIQCSALVDARTFEEEQADLTEEQRRAALTDEERQVEDQARFQVAWGDLLEPGKSPTLLDRVRARAAADAARFAGREVLQEGRWIEVQFWLAYVEVRRVTSDGEHREDRLYLVHPGLGYGTEYNAMLADLGQMERDRREGKTRWMRHDYRDWFAGRVRAVDPLGDGDIG
ncbi:hypothetical protein [Deinococcus aluminii]|uniref:Uncharacterized protein n=1 Tax=Deinococcus aluminii TaxID=1656885 RepID=A0ABP9XEQ3_9DEIO